MADLGGSGIVLGDGVDTGSLTAILTQHRTDIGAIDAVTGVVSVASIGALTALSKSGLTDDDYVIVKGYYAPADGGGGLFQWDAASTATANVGTVFAADEGGTGRWLRDYKGYSAFNVKWFGAKCDSSNDDTSAIQAAIDLRAGPVYIPPARPVAINGVIVTQLQVHAGTILRGNGVEGSSSGTILKQKAGSNLSVIVEHPTVADNYLHGLVIQDLRIKGDSGSTGGSGIDFDIMLGEASKIERVHISEMPGSGFSLHGGTPAALADCAAFRNGVYGFHVFGGGGMVLQRFMVHNISGDNNEIALFCLESHGQSHNLIDINGVKSETSIAGKQQNVILLKNTNSHLVSISNVGHLSIGITTNAVIQCDTSAVFTVSNIRCTPTLTSYWIQDTANSKTLARDTSAKQSIVDGVWDSAKANASELIRLTTTLGA